MKGGGEPYEDVVESSSRQENSRDENKVGLLRKQ